MNSFLNKKINKILKKELTLQVFLKKYEKFSVFLIEWCLECNNVGLTDSIKYFFT